jgi:hypothetical protein
MLDEYKTPDRFWAEAINTACFSINQLYLHRILKMTSYELLTGKKPNVSYFRVFGSKCFILVKRGRKSKFAPKAVEGFLLGYDSNTKAYRVFNKSTGLVEVSCDIVFDETNGSQVEQVDLDELDDETNGSQVAPCVALRNMSIGDVCPKESEKSPQTQDQLSSSMQASPPTQDEDQDQNDKNEVQEDEPSQEEDNDQRGDDHDKDKEDEQEIQGQKPPHPRVHQAIQRDHPVNSIPNGHVFRKPTRLP